MKKIDKDDNVVRFPACELERLGQAALHLCNAQNGGGANLEKPVRVTANLGREGRERAAAAARRVLKLLPKDPPNEEEPQT